MYEEKEKWGQEKVQIELDFRKQLMILGEENNLYKKEIQRLEKERF
jgi:hypothetical protein